jgi:hypothetical protein
MQQEAGGPEIPCNREIIKKPELKLSRGVMLLRNLGET